MARGESETDDAAIDFPPYSYTPGFFPHPFADAAGHRFRHDRPPPRPLTGAHDADHPEFRLGVALFNRGYYWEAHEAWESLWLAAKQAPPLATFLKGLIKLAAAGVKAKEGRPAGVNRHAIRAAALFSQARDQLGQDHAMGLSIERLIAIARAIVNSADSFVHPMLDIQPLSPFQIRKQ